MFSLPIYQERGTEEGLVPAHIQKPRCLDLAGLCTLHVFGEEDLRFTSMMTRSFLRYKNFSLGKNMN